MGNVQGRVDLREKDGLLQMSRDGGATWANASSGSGDAWFDAVRADMLLLCPTLTRFEFIKPTKAGMMDPTIAVEGTTIEGGAVGVASDTNFARFTTAVWTAPRTIAMAVAFRVKFPAISASKISTVGAAIVAATGGIFSFGWNQATDATKWVCSVSGGSAIAPTVVADTLEHTVQITVNPATPLITFKLDGVIIGTSVEVSTLTNSACSPGAFSSASITPGNLVGRVAYGYVDPLV